MNKIQIIRIQMNKTFMKLNKLIRYKFELSQFDIDKK